MTDDRLRHDLEVSRYGGHGPECPLCRVAAASPAVPPGDAESYGCCLVCGATRAVEHLERDGGAVLRVVCPNPACPSPDGRNER